MVKVCGYSVWLKCVVIVCGYRVWLYCAVIARGTMEFLIVI